MRASALDQLRDQCDTRTAYIDVRDSKLLPRCDTCNVNVCTLISKRDGDTGLVVPLKLVLAHFLVLGHARARPDHTDYLLALPDVMTHLCPKHCQVCGIRISLPACSLALFLSVQRRTYPEI